MGPQETPQLPVVFLHGAGQDGEIWAEVVPLVTRPVIVHEFPAHGGRFGAPLERVEDLAEDVVGHLPGGQAALLVGHSLGGAVALEAALRRPECVSGLVVLCAELDPQPDRRAMAALEGGDLERFIELIHLGIVGPRQDTQPPARPHLTRPPGPPARLHPARPPGPPARLHPARPPGPPARPGNAVEVSARRLQRVVRRTGLRATAADYRAAAAHHLTGRLGGLAMPVAVLAGGRDVLVPPRRVASLAAELDVEEEVILNSSHQVPWEAPEAVADAVERVRSAADG